MNRNRWIIVSIIILGLLIVGIAFLLNNRSGNPEELALNETVLNLAYCNDEQVKPCVVSFGIDANNNMLVNFLLPDMSFPGFYLEITRGEQTISYKCQRIATSPNNAYCVGENLPPGEVLRLILISTRNDTVLAEGDLPIIGLAFPTLESVIPTDTPTAVPETSVSPEFLLPTATPTETFDFVLPTPTKTSAPPSYPNPSYP